MTTHSDDVQVEMPKFSIARDKCEKDPLDDLFPKGVDIVPTDLRPSGGDYSATGYEDYVAIERKSIKDLLGTLWGKTQLADGSWQPNLGRFAYELSKLSRKHLSYVAIEGSRSDLELRIAWRQRECRRYGKEQRITYAKTMGLISSLEAEFGVCFCFFKDRNEMAGAIYADLYHAWRRANGLSKSKIGDYTPSPLNNSEQSEGSIPKEIDDTQKKDADDSVNHSTFDGEAN